MDVEFKLFGSLTVKQFGYIVAGGLLALFFYFVFKEIGSMLLAWIFIFLSVVLGLSLALIRINDQPFEVWLGNFLAAMFTSQKRVWKKEKKESAALSGKKVTVPPPIPVKSLQKVPTVAKTPPVQAPSIPKHPFKPLNQTPQQVPRGQQGAVSNMPGSSADTANEHKADIAGDSVKGNFRYVPGTAQGAVKVTSNQQPNRPISLSPTSNTNPGNPVPKQSAFLAPDDSNQPSQKTPGLKDLSNTQSPSDLWTGGETTTPSKTGVGRLPNQPSSQPAAVPLQKAIPASQIQPSQPLQGGTPQDASSGQAGTSHTNKAVNFSDVLPDKSTTLKTVMKDEATPPVTTPVSSNEDVNLEEENEALRQKVAEFSEDRSKLEQKATQASKMCEELKKQNEQLLQQMGELQRNFQEIKEEKTKEEEKAKTTLPPLPQKSATPKASQDASGVLSPRIYNGPYLSKKPNVISGIVKSKDGNLLPGVVVIIKNEKNRPVRAMKTNSLGQFVTTTALENGDYTVELSKKDYSFGRYEIKLTGEVVPTYEFIAD